MKKGFTTIGIIIVAGMLILGAWGASNQEINLGATPALQSQQGGTGTSTTPTDGHLLCGDEIGQYGGCELVEGSNITISTTTSADGLGTITISSSGVGGTGSNWTYVSDAQLDFLTPSTTVGVIFNASTTFTGATTTLSQRSVYGTSSPTTIENSTVYIEALTSTDHAAIFRGTLNQSVHIWMVEDNIGTELWAISASGVLDGTLLATADGQHLVNLQVDAAGFADINGIFINYIVGAIAAGEDEAAILVNLNRLGATNANSDVMALQVLATAGLSEAEALHVGAGVHVIHQFSGVFVDMDECTQSPGLTDILSSCTSTVSDVTIFANDNDELVIGDANQFSEISFALDTVASGAGIMPTFEFSTGSDTWTIFSPTDATNGMRGSGNVSWELSDIPTWATGTSTRYFIRITRTQNGLPTPPIEDLIQIAATVEYVWDENGDLVIRNATSTNATTTDFHISNSLFMGGDVITDFVGTNLSIDSSGVLNASGGDAFAWTFVETGKVSTSTELHFGAGFVSQASSTVVGDFTIENPIGTTTLNGGFTIETTGFVYDFVSNSIGIGTAPNPSILSSPQIHIFKTSAGGVKCTNFSHICIESNTGASLSFITDNNDSSAQGIIWGDQGDADAARILYIHNGNKMGFYQSGIENLRMKVTDFDFNPTGRNTDFRFRGDNDAALLFIDGGTDRVGIGTSSPLVKLSVDFSGEGDVFELLDTDGRCLQDPDSGGITTSCTSDEKLKKNIRASESYLDILTSIPLKTYEVKSSGDTRLGPVAQELELIRPEMVRTPITYPAIYDEIFDDEENLISSTLITPTTTDTTKFIVIPSTWQLIKAIQELNEITVQQQAEIEALKLRVDKLDGLGTEPVIVDEQGNLLSNPLFVGFGGLLLVAMGAWFVRRRTN